MWEQHVGVGHACEWLVMMEHLWKCVPESVFVVFWGNKVVSSCTKHAIAVCMKECHCFVLAAVGRTSVIMSVSSMLLYGISIIEMTVMFLFCQEPFFFFAFGWVNHSWRHKNNVNHDIMTLVHNQFCAQHDTLPIPKFALHPQPLTSMSNTHMLLPHVSTNTRVLTNLTMAPSVSNYGISLLTSLYTILTISIAD